MLLGRGTHSTGSTGTTGTTGTSLSQAPVVLQKGQNMSTKRKRAVLAFVAILTLVAGGIAFAYFTASGSGSGDATVGNAGVVTLSGTTTGTLYPGGAAGDVAITVTNPGGVAQHVTAVHLASVTADGSHPTCDVSAFSMPDVTVNATIAAGGNTVVHGSLTMADTGVSQNSCQGAGLTLSLTSN